MRTIKKLLKWTIAAAAVLVLTVKPGWADSFTMANIAMAEYWNGEREEPIGSDAIKYNEWFFGYPVHSTDDLQYEWNTAFVSWCADQLGYISRDCFPRTNDPSEMFQWFAQRGYQPYSGDFVMNSDGSLNVKAGDIAFISPEGSSSLRTGIVTSADALSVTCAVGDMDGSIELIQIDNIDPPMDVVYYPVIPAESDNYYEIVEFLSSKMNLNPAAVCGIVANIIYESNGMPNALGDNGTSYGLCQWHQNRWQDLINYCNAAGYDWESLEGQLMFLWYELDNTFSDLKNVLISCPTSPNGAYQAGYCFCLTYEAPEDLSTKAEIRGSEAMCNIFPYWYG